MSVCLLACLCIWQSGGLTIQMCRSADEAEEDGLTYTSCNKLAIVNVGCECGYVKTVVKKNEIFLRSQCRIVNGEMAVLLSQVGHEDRGTVSSYVVQRHIFFIDVDCRLSREKKVPNVAGAGWRTGVVAVHRLDEGWPSPHER